jgi:phosphatidylglycerol---prolipoprotein diacylglyceryl transferase
MADHWVHNLDPVALHLWGSMAIRWYGLAYLAGVVWGVWMVIRWHRRQRCPLNATEAQDFALYGGLGMIIGGRLGYCLMYAWPHFVSDPLYLFRLWEGGMASHGGILGLMAGAWLYARKRQVAVPLLFDMIAAVAPMGVMLGRLANFVNGELWGKPTDVPWAVIFPLSGDYLPRHPSQLYEALLEGALLLAIIIPVHARHRKPGLTSGVLLALYAMVRFIGEFFREPDFGHPPYFGWMNKGQALSIPVLLIGLGIAIWAARRPSRPELYADARQPQAKDVL